MNKSRFRFSNSHQLLQIRIQAMWCYLLQQVLVILKVVNQSSKAKTTTLHGLLVLKDTNKMGHSKRYAGKSSTQSWLSAGWYNNVPSTTVWPMVSGKPQEHTVNKSTKNKKLKIFVQKHVPNILSAFSLYQYLTQVINFGITHECLLLLFSIT